MPCFAVIGVQLRECFGTAHVMRESHVVAVGSLHLDTLEISQEVPEVGAWIGNNVGGTGVGAGMSDFCGDATKAQNTEVNLTGGVVDATFGKRTCMDC
jgi:acetyl-CoA carboxylase carboxyltransferase component